MKLERSTTKMSVSIIIPAWNESTTLKATVQGLLDMDYDTKQCEVIVVAGGDDDTYEVARELSATMATFLKYVVIMQAPGGKNSAIQEGRRRAKNEIIVLLDADTIVSQQWLKCMIGPIEQGYCDLTIANPEPVTKNWVSDYYMITKTYFLDSISTFSGGSIAFKASIVENRLEYFFDKEVKVGVDYLLAKRFLEDGREIRFAKDACVTTYFPSSLKYFILTELRWLTAYINIEGVNWRTLACNTAVVAALMLAIPLSNTLWVLSLLFNLVYVSKRVHMFVVASRHYATKQRNGFGFIMLSYAHHTLGFICYVRYFLGLSKSNYLSQGQRC